MKLPDVNIWLAAFAMRCGFQMITTDQTFSQFKGLDLLARVPETPPQAWETLTKNHGAQAGETLLARLRDQIDQRGTLDGKAKAMVGVGSRVEAAVAWDGILLCGSGVVRLVSNWPDLQPPHRSGPGKTSENPFDFYALPIARQPEP